VRVAYRVPLLVLAFLSLGFGIAAGLARLGFALGLPAPSLSALHGALMAGAFFGGVIGLERAVALGRLWAFAAPLAGGSAGLAWILGAPVQAGGALLLASGLVLLGASLVVFRMQPALHNAVLAAGAASFALGGAAVAAGEITVATPVWIGFLVLTIAGERLELSRFMPPSPGAKRVFAFVCALAFGASVLAVFKPALGWKLLAAALLALAVWLALKDIARRTVRERGLTRYIAVALLSGYAWLAIGALVALATPEFAPGRPAWDAALHAWFLGFVFSMVFGHAPIIAPALLRVALPYHAVFYAPLVVLHVSVALRVAGSLLVLPQLREAAALGHALAIVFFILTVVTRALGARGPQKAKV
jgi:hypothetical protein